MKRCERFAQAGGRAGEEEKHNLSSKLDHQLSAPYDTMANTAAGQVAQHITSVYLQGIKCDPAIGFV